MILPDHLEPAFLPCPHCGSSTYTKAIVSAERVPLWYRCFRCMFRFD